MKYFNSLREEIGDCTGFMAHCNNKTFFGINEDIHDYDPKMLLYNEDINNNLYKRIIFKAFHKNMKVHTSGVNNKGLMFDQYDHLFYPAFKSLFKKPFRPLGDIEAYCIAKCSTVKEVIEVFKKYKLWHMSIYQSFFVDKTGDWVIIEGNNFYQKNIENIHGVKYQVCTNFIQSHPRLLIKLTAWEEQKWRYNVAKYLLEELTSDYFINDIKQLKNYFKKISDATHLTLTKYSYITDLNNNNIYLYFHGNFNQEKSFNIDKIIKDNFSFETNHDPRIPIELSIPSFCKTSNIKVPKKPKIYGPSGLLRMQEGKFYANSYDPEIDKLLYCFDWSDGSLEEWIEPINDNTKTCKMKHSWDINGEYLIRVKARNYYGDESPWSEPIKIRIL